MTNIIITELIDSYVKFTSPLGHGMASWSGDMPVVGCNYNVEIDIDEHLEFGENLFSSGGNVSSVSVVNKKITFVAEVISYEDDGVLTVSLGGDIIFLEVSLPSVINGYVEFLTSPDKVYLYPVDL
ncbi:hypothetical protein AB4J97_03095 [Serratia fonticola]|uniref:hypothetical protein n=1 Tax=Serratia fonticola TaxID=47917 RepID=UPI0021B774DF|nr:hypothetical protein [Serratia fonticola]